MVPINIALTIKKKKPRLSILRKSVTVCHSHGATDVIQMLFRCYLDVIQMTSFQIFWMIWLKCEATFKAIENLGNFLLCFEMSKSNETFSTQKGLPIFLCLSCSKLRYNVSRLLLLHVESFYFIHYFVLFLLFHL